MNTLMYPVEHDYLHNAVHVLSAQQIANGTVAVVLTHTAFDLHQAKQGVIVSQTAEFAVHQIRVTDGIVHHIGQFLRGRFVSGEVVSIKIA